MTKKYYAEEKWGHDYETTRPLIVERNKDVEHILYASCQYGSHGFGQQNRIKLFAMLATTDIHTSSRQLQSAVDYLNYYEPIDCGICLGTWSQSPICTVSVRKYSLNFTTIILLVKSAFACAVSGLPFSVTAP